MFKLVCLLLGYLIGNFQTAYLVGKLFYKMDIRKHGSGNAGTTNVTRVLGTRAGIYVFVCDVLKGVLATVVCSLIFGGDGTFTNGSGYLPALYGGLGAIIGHNFPAFLKFKGGKGIATSLGVILCINPIIALILYVMGVVSVSLTKFISLASLVILGAFPLLLLAFSFSLEEVALGFVMAALAYYQHRDNIKRLMAGNERKFSFKKTENLERSKK